MELHMPRMDGIEATQAIKQELPQVTVLVLTAFADPNYLWEALKAGASGYLLKSASSQEIANAVRAVLKGESPLDQQVAMQLIMGLIEEKQREVAGSSEEHALGRKPDEEGQRAPLPKPLTPREVEVVRLLAQGQSNQQIAQNLSISVSTVKHHVHVILTKLGVSDRTRAVVRAIDHGLLTLCVTEELIEGAWLVDLLN
jgi:DNA-binding NarL/FixJ family response regulator